jgi:dolichol-phosphate mannosyltransferase
LKRLTAALDAIVSFSYLPIRLISGIGFLISSLSMGYAFFVCMRKIFFSYGGDGWPSLMVAVLFLSGLQMIMLGILGEYLWRVSDQTKGRPPFIISKKDCF